MYITEDTLYTSKQLRNENFNHSEFIKYDEGSTWWQTWHRRIINSPFINPLYGIVPTSPFEDGFITMYHGECHISLLSRRLRCITCQPAHHTYRFRIWRISLCSAHIMLNIESVFHSNAARSAFLLLLVHIQHVKTVLKLAVERIHNIISVKSIDAGLETIP